MVGVRLRRADSLQKENGEGSEIRGQRSEIMDQRSEIRDQGSEIRKAPWLRFCLSHPKRTEHALDGARGGLFEKRANRG